MRLSRPTWYAGNVPWLLTGRIARSFSQAVLVIAVPLYVSAAGYSTVQVGYLLSLALLGSTVLTLIVGIFSDRYGRKLMLMAIAALGIVGASVFSVTTTFWVLAVMAGIAAVRGGGAGSGGGLARSTLRNRRLLLKVALTGSAIRYFPRCRWWEFWQQP